MPELNFQFVGTEAVDDRETPLIQSCVEANRASGNRFSHAANKVELLKMKKILIAGLGNIFHGDEGFGCEVIHELIFRNLPEDVSLVDFGIRRYDLARALTDGYAAAILVGATPRNASPGTVFLTEPDLHRPGRPEPSAIDPSAMNPATVLPVAQSLGTIFGKIYLVDCEPAVLENDSDEIGLSLPVRRAVRPAVEMIESLVNDLLGFQKPKTDAGIAPA